MTSKLLLSTVIAISFAALLSSCASIPKNASPVQNFDIDKYLGSWYEIARFDFRFEKDMNNVMAQYSLNEKNNVAVLNSGYNYKKEEWVSANGVAKFRGNKNTCYFTVNQYF